MDKSITKINYRQCVRLLDHFVYKNHVCMVFKLFANSLFDYFKQVKFMPFSLREIQSFAKQLLVSVSFLHDNGFVHTDLKPGYLLLIIENLMLVDDETINVPCVFFVLY